MSTNTETILIVEDDPGVARLQARQLERAGYRAVTAATVGEAMEQLRLQAVDLAVLDFRLPGAMTGLELFEQIKNAGFVDLPVIMVTGFSNEATLIQALRAGVQDFVSKSVEYLEYLPEAVERLLKQNRLKAALQQKDAELRQAQKLEAVGQLAGGVAHEFNNLLQAIFGYTEFAKESLGPDHPARAELAEVEKATERAATLTRQMLTFSRRDVLRRNAFDPNTAVRDLLKMLRPLIGADVELEANLADDTGVIHADPGLLQQVLLNLCINARDAMPAGGRLTIKTERMSLDAEYCEAHQKVRPGEYFVLSVSDTGCGMAPDVQARIFEPFFTTKEVGKGTGLGLSFVHGVVEQHGGVIHVYSELGSGTIFRIYLPLGSSPGESTPEPTKPVALGGSETILIADDEPYICDLGRRVLQKAGYTVLTAPDGDEALRRFSEHTEAIALVVLDVVLPKVCGDEIYRRIRILKPDVAVVFCSGYDSDSARTEFVLREGLPLLQKPFPPQALLSTVRAQLDANVAGLIR